MYRPRVPQEGSAMRVCMVAYTFYETDNRVMRYAETLAKRGDEVDVIAHYGTEKGNFFRNGVRVLRVQQRIPNEKSKFTYLFRICLFFIRAMILLSFNHLRKPYKLIHVHSVPDFLVFTAWLPKLMGAKVILDIHDLLPEFYASKFLGDKPSKMFGALVWVEKISCAFADHVILPNHLWQRRLEARHLPASKCSVIMNYPDPSIFHRRGRTRSDDRFIILYPGTLAVHQGLDVAIRAFAKIKNVVPEADFHIRGSGPAREDLEALVKELHLEDRVFFLPGMPMWDIAQVMEDADLAVVPKRKDTFGNEAFSTKTLEFMSVGVPLLISDTAVDLFYFNDQIVTFATSGDENDFAAKMVQLIRNPAARQKQVQNADAFAKLNSWEVRKAEYLDLVDSLTGNVPSSPSRMNANVTVQH
jgi:glycosyltransferase involved in cell wall biosynthesis